jgi:hypothetical protein
LPIFFVIFLSLGIIILLFVFALPPTAKAFIALFGSDLDWLAWYINSLTLFRLVSIILTLLEAAIAIFLLSFFILERLSDKVFDLVLKKQCPGFIDESGSGITSRLKETGSDFKELLLFITTLPLNLIPVVGTVGFILINGYLSGPFLHTYVLFFYILSSRRYFRQKNWSQVQKEAFVDLHRAQYSEIGRVKAALDLVPVVNSFSSILFAVVAALWASQLESQI